MIIIIHLTILTPSLCRQQSKGGLQQQQKAECIVRLRSKEFLKFLGFTGFGDFWIKWGRKGVVRFCFLYLTLRLMCYHIWANEGHTISRNGLFFSSKLIFLTYILIFLSSLTSSWLLWQHKVWKKKKNMLRHFYILWEYIYIYIYIYIDIYIYIYIIYKFIGLMFH